MQNDVALIQFFYVVIEALRDCGSCDWETGVCLEEYKHSMETLNDRELWDGLVPTKELYQTQSNSFDNRFTIVNNTILWDAVPGTCHFNSSRKEVEENNLIFGQYMSRYNALQKAALESAETANLVANMRRDFLFWYGVVSIGSSVLVSALLVCKLDNLKRIK